MLFQASESLAASAKTLALLSLFAAVRYKKNPEPIDKFLSPSLYAPTWRQSVSNIPVRTADRARLFDFHDHGFAIPQPLPLRTLHGPITCAYW